MHLCLPSCRRLSILAMLVILAVVAPAPSLAAAAPATPAPVTLSSTPFSADGSAVPNRARIEVTLERPTRVAIKVLNFAGSVIRTIVKAQRAPGTWQWTWNGKNDAGKTLSDGAYRIRINLTAGSDVQVVNQWVTKAARAIYPPAPETITVALDPGHGGSDRGATGGPRLEKDLNLDIAQRLRRMLEGAGVNVIMTRTEDVEVNLPAVDLTGDGEINQRDELAARIDIANRARADLLVSIHNNATSCRCGQGSEVLFEKRRSFSDASMKLARRVHLEQMAQLKRHRTAAWRPIDRGVKHRVLYVLRPYREDVIERPSAMPAILGESLFADHPVEGKMLARAKVRQAIAAGYYLGIARYLSNRPYGVRYQLVDSPSVLGETELGRYELELQHRAWTLSSGWQLEARSVPAAPIYDGAPDRGLLLASVPVPDGFGPADAIRLVMADVPPPPPGDWIVKFDLRLPDGTTAGDHGVVALQVPLTVTADDPPSPGVGPGAGPTRPSWPRDDGRAFAPIPSGLPGSWYVGDYPIDRREFPTDPSHVHE